MGFLRRLFGLKKPTFDTSDSIKDPKKKNRRWSFVKSTPHSDSRNFTTPSQPNSFVSASNYGEPFDANKHAIAVAAATAAVAEAALAAAHAAAEVVRLTSGAGAGKTSGNRRWAKELAAIKIQSAFRSYLARRALRALKALVKLQALVRGHIVRKHAADMLRRMQTLVRVQARARATRSHSSSHTLRSGSATRSSLSHHYFQPTYNRNEHQLRAHSSKFEGSSILKRCGSNSNFRDTINVDKTQAGSSWLDCWMEENLWINRRDSSPKNIRADDEKTDKILEVDTWKPHLKTSHLGLTLDYNDQSFRTSDSLSKYSTKKAANPTPGETLSLSSLKFPTGKDEVTLRTADNSPQVHSASSRPGSSSRKGQFTPTRSECSWSYLSGYPGYPNYMSNTESSRAKLRSHSAPKQRLEFDKYGSTAKASFEGYWDTWNQSDIGFSRETDSINNAYAIAGHLTRVRSTKLR